MTVVAVRPRILVAGLCALALGVGSSVAGATPQAGAGFRMPSGLVQCGLGTLTGAEPALFCAAPYIRQRQYDGQGVVTLPPAGRARVFGAGNDILLLIGGYGYRPGATRPSRFARPVLAYGRTWRRAGYTCSSASTGLTCRRGKHGFFLSTQRQRLFGR